MDFSQSKALVVDDDEFVRNILLRQLAGLGLTQVVVAADGQSALQACREQGPFTLMICDLMMPGMDGVQLLREVAAIQADLALILMSSVERKVLATVEDLARARGLRLLGSVQKPVRVDDLRKLLTQIAAPRLAATSKSAVPEVTVQELRAAIQAGEMDVYVQPQVDARSRALAGVEALARWRSPSRGLVAPDRFIPLAEQNGLIEELTGAICRKAMGACAAWKAAGLETRVSINISYSSLEHLDFPERILALCADFGLPPRLVQMEITETGVMQNLVHSLDVLTRLRMCGIELAIDDFGTGHSSLTQLKRIPFNELKIDQTFVKGVTTDDESRRIVESSISLARGLGLRTIAEGVETAADATLLRELGCDLLQGYFIARPMPASSLAGWEAANR